MPRKLGRVASDQHTYIGGKVLELLRERTVQTRLVSRSGVGAIGTTEGGCWVGLSDNIGLLLRPARRQPVGFKLKAASKFGEQAETVYEVWHGPHFHAPQVGLDDASIDGPALTDWRCCLEAGEARAAYERAWSQTNQPNRQSACRTASARAVSLKPPLESR